MSGALRHVLLSLLIILVAFLTEIIGLRGTSQYLLCDRLKQGFGSHIPFYKIYNYLSYASTFDIEICVARFCAENYRAKIPCSVLLNLIAFPWWKFISIHYSSRLKTLSCNTSWGTLQVKGARLTISRDMLILTVLELWHIDTYKSCLDWVCYSRV